MCPVISASKPVGSFQPVGKVKGRFITADPTGRFIALQRSRSTISVHDTQNALASVFTCRASDDSYALALHPSGKALARLTKDWTLEFRQKNKKRLQYSTQIASSPLLSSDMSLRWGIHGAGWLHYTADGNYLLFGDVEKKARLCLFDAKTQNPLDIVSEVIGSYPREPIDDWGEDIMSVNAPAPSNAIAFASNAGDDILVMGVAEVENNRLKLYGVGNEKNPFTDKIPGERANGICLRDDTLFVVDSDEILTCLSWKETPFNAKHFGSGYEFLVDELTTPALLQDLRKQGSDALRERIILNGPLEVVGNYLLVTVEQEKVWGTRMGWINLAYLFFEIDSLTLVGWLEAPAKESDEYLSLYANGIICKTIEEETFVWRFVPLLVNGLIR